MGIINQLDPQTANMIAAGEVVERPASALKELVENSIDAGATKITAEIRGGGVLLLKVTDNGCGIEKEDLPKAILRHATGKIKTAEDLDGVTTLGFRGEALAALSSVAKTEIISKKKDCPVGYRLYCGEFGVELDEFGCPDGTTVAARELFYNQPARKKFLKKDSSEAAACLPVMEKLALANPHIAFTFISEGEKRFYTTGNGSLLDAIYSVYGKAEGETFIKADFAGEKASVEGYVSSPENPRGSRRGQIFFLNSRCINSKTMQAALERAYESYIPKGKFPACVLNIKVDPYFVDVNVHPAKLEVKFADEKRIFEAVYCAVRNAFNKPDAENAFKEKPQRREAPMFSPRSPVEKPLSQWDAIEKLLPHEELHQPFTPSFEEPKSREPFDFLGTVKKSEPETPPKQEEAVQQIIPDNTEAFTYIGEMWSTYIAITKGDEFILVDKHALHERLVYEQLLGGRKYSPQQLLTGIPVTLSAAEMVAVNDNKELFYEYGYEFDEFGSDTVLIRAVPTPLFGKGTEKDLFLSLCEAVTENQALPLTERCDRAVYTAACKTAIRAGDKTGKEENEFLIKQLFENPDVRYCPHGRPVMKIFKKTEINKYFDR